MRRLQAFFCARKACQERPAVKSHCGYFVAGLNRVLSFRNCRTAILPSSEGWEGLMRSHQRYVFWVAALAVAAWTAPRAFVFAEDTPPLKLVQTIELKDIRSGEPDVSA